MTTLEARIASLEHDLAILATVLQDVAISQTLFASLTPRQLQTLIAKCGDCVTRETSGRTSDERAAE